MNSFEVFKGGRVLAIRGKYTAMKLKEKGFTDCNVYGDPALLLPLWLQPKCRKKYKIGIIPHWSETDYFIEQYEDRYNIIDLRTDDIEEVVKQICSCEYILSTSLHGLIVAHAYSIPALWLKKGYIDTDGFKFKDYFSSVDIPLYDGVEYDNRILTDENEIVGLFHNNTEISLIQNSLQEIQQKLLSSFPYPLIKKYQDKLALLEK